MNLILFLVAFCVGIAMSVQAAVNSQLASSIGANSVAAALVSFSCGTVALLAVFLAPRIGLLSLIVLVIAGQLFTSMAIDHFGLIHMAVRKVSAVRVAGALVVALGVAITLFGDRIVASMGR